MTVSQYWVGQIPARPIAITVYGSDGRATPLDYTEYKVRLIGSDNEEIDLDGSTLNVGQASTGRFTFKFPTDRSLFNKTGEYLLQLEFVSGTARDFTTEHHIKVRKLGGKN